MNTAKPETLKRDELVKRVCARLKNEGTMFPTNTAIEHVFDAVEAELHNSVTNMEEVLLFGIGKIKFDLREARVRRNPQTGGPVNCPPKYVMRLRPSSEVTRVLKLKMEADMQNGEVAA